MDALLGTHKSAGTKCKRVNNNIFKNLKHNESRKQQMKTALLNLLPQLLSLRNNHIIFCEEKNLTQTIKHQPLRQTFLTLTVGIFSPSFLYTCLKSLSSVSVIYGSAVSDSVWPHGLQHASVPCPSPTSVACSNSGPSSRWCHPTISSSVGPSPAYSTELTHGSIDGWLIWFWNSLYTFLHTNIILLSHFHDWIIHNCFFFPLKTDEVSNVSMT